MEGYVCIHGHFYQPPRENPWLELVEQEDSAHPWHDWNERITEECYAANAAARVLDEQGRVVKVINNYSRISFDFGPTLFRWLEGNAPEVYEAIIEGDRLAAERFSGHGSALAHPYTHLILPLAPRRDKYTQILWGIKDFEYRFGRRPEGMWLPECAVDTETLEVMAEFGLRFTVLAPHQALRVRPLKGGEWQEVEGGRVDVSRAYLVRLPSGREMATFFFQAPLSHAVAFGDLLRDGGRLVRRLLEAIPPGGAGRLVSIAIDGETFGHHKTFGEMALAYALQGMEARLTNYGEFLDGYPPEYEVQIAEGTSWSCPHGLGRWRSDCGCSTGTHPGWNQGWRGPLRGALDWLRDTLAQAYEARGGLLFKDPWAARDDYVEVILDPSRRDSFLDRHSRGVLGTEERITALKLLEMQRHLLLMYTSCAWFFDDPSGIEALQVLRHAARAVQLAEEILRDRFEGEFLRRLEAVKSNIAEVGDGRRIYERSVIPAKVDLPRVCAHWAMGSLFEDGQGEAVGCFRIQRRRWRLQEAGRAKLALGRALVRDEITEESKELSFAVLHLGDHNLLCGVKGEEIPAIGQGLLGAFDRGDLTEAMGLLQRGFPELYPLRALFKDQQRRILALIQAPALERAEALCRELYEENAPMIRFLKELAAPLPKVFRVSAEIAINGRIMEVLAEGKPSLEELKGLLQEVEATGVSLEVELIQHGLRSRLQGAAKRLLQDPLDPEAMELLEAGLEAARVLPLEVDLLRVQGTFWKVLEMIRLMAEGGDTRAQEVLPRALALAEVLSIRVEP